jgi:hypothetical protein
MFDTDAVFHAPMFALNVDAPENACEPNRTRSTPTESARKVRRRCAGDQTHTLMRARTQVDAHVDADVEHARIGDPFIDVDK